MSGQNQFLNGVLLLTLSLFAPALLAEGKSSSLIFKKRKPFQVTGQLAPFRFIVDNRLLFEQPRSYTEIKVNGTAVKLQDQSGRLFSFEIDQDSISVEATGWNGVSDTYKLKIGRLKESKYDGEQFRFTVDGSIFRATIDGSEVAMAENKIVWHPGKRALEPHQLVLVGEGKIPDTQIEFQLVNQTEFKKLTAQKRREDRKNPNRLIAGKKEGWLDKVTWQHVEVDLGLRFGAESSFSFSASLTPKYVYNKTWGLKGFAGLAAFSSAGGGFALGPKIGLHLTHELDAFPINLEVGPSVYVLSQAVGFSASVDLAAAYSLAGMVDFVHAVGLGYSFWLTPSAHTIRGFIEFKF